MQAEVQFLRYASYVAPGFTPTLIHADLDHRCVVLENIVGKPFPVGEPPDSQAVYAAVEFMQLLNRNQLLAKQSIQIDAAEGFLGLTEHLTNVQERLDALTCAHVEKESKDKAKMLLNYVRTELADIVDKTHESINKGVISDFINIDKRCISPSDFGFHNAINTANGVRFIDFEFAGWDDPAKATIDFILQPRIPVIGFGSPLLAAWHPKDQNLILRRCQHMLPILRLKWICILLSVLNPARLEQMITIMPEQDCTRLISQRLESASRYLTCNQISVMSSEFIINDR